MKTLSLTKPRIFLMPAVLSLAGGCLMVAAISQHHYISELEAHLVASEAELSATTSELEALKPELAFHLIRNQARLDYANQQRQAWSDQFGYSSSIQVRTPEAIAYGDEFSMDAAIQELVELSEAAGHPMSELVEEAVSSD